MAPHRLRPVGGLLVALCLLGYTLLWVGFALQWSWLTGMDDWALETLYEYGSGRSGWIRFWDIYCTVFGPGGFRLLSVVVAVIAWAQRNVRAALFAVATAMLSGVATLLAKYSADRPRPPGILITLTDSSFPSGHALAVMSAVLGLWTLSAGLLSPRMRPVAVVAGVFIVVSVGVGRVVLNAHHPSDVLAGWALGYVWYVLCVVVIRPRPLQRRRGLSDDAAAAGTPEVRGSAS